MSMFGTERDVDAIAEYADSSVRVMSRRGSLVPVSGRHGFNEWLYNKWGNRGNALYTFTGGLLTIALSGALAWGLDEPLVFPSLGATAFLFFETPMAEVASPRNTIVGHYVGALVATLWLFVFGLQDNPNVLVEGFSPAVGRVHGRPPAAAPLGPSARGRHDGHRECRVAAHGLAAGRAGGGSGAAHAVGTRHEPPARGARPALGLAALALTRTL
jgi:hypothetical protein